MRLAAAALLVAAVSTQARAVKIERIPWNRPSDAGGPTTREVAAERLMVKFSSSSVASGQKDAALRAVGGTVTSEISNIGWTMIQLASGTSVVSALSAIQNLPGVEQAEPDNFYRINAYPSDPQVPQQYSFFNTDAFSAWDISTGLSTADGKPVTIAIIDSGIDGTNQADVDPKLLDVITGGAVQSQSFDPDNGDAQAANSLPTPACEHATETSSVAAAVTNNATGIAGVSWGARIISLKVFNNLDCNSDCSAARCVAPTCGCGTEDSTLIAALNYAANTLQGTASVGHLIVNMSIGGPTSCSGAMSAALANAISKGVPVTISAGNSGQAVESPANCAGTGGPAAGIIPVGATNSSNQVTSYSSNGPELAAHGVVAPGDNVPVDTPNNGTKLNSGTSFSAPFVAGMAALMTAVRPTITPAQVETFLRGGSNSIGGQSIGTQGNVSGAGQVNVFRSVKLAQNGTLASFDGDQKAIAFPNPFRIAQATIVSFSVPTSLQSSNTEIKIFTVNGQLVRDLKTLVWDGKNDNGQLVASGTYLFEVKTDAGKTTGRMAVIR